MFIEELWRKNPEKVTQAVKNICKVNEERGDRFFAWGIEDRVLRFSKYGTSSFEVYVEDFDIKLSFFCKEPVKSPLGDEWRKFMTSVFGNRYIQNYLATRNAELKRYAHDFKKETNQNAEKLVEYLEENNTNNIK